MNGRRVHGHAATRLALWSALVPLALAWCARGLTPHPELWYGLCAAASLFVLAAAWRISREIQAPLNTAANLVTALREGNYSLRGRVAASGGAELLMEEINALAAELRTDRLAETEASELLAKVMSEIDTAVIAFDAAPRVVLENLAAARLLRRDPGSLTGQTVAELGVRVDLDRRGIQRLDTDLPAALGPFELRVQPFRYRGREHTLLVMTSLFPLLRNEERSAQRRIISVLSHEINNSLAPIKSLAGRLQSLSARLGADAHEASALMPATSSPPLLSAPFEDLQTGLAVIERRSEHLGRVMHDYAKLARTAEPTFRPIVVHDWIARAARLWPSVHVENPASPALTLRGDEALLDQVLLNLIKNALEASGFQDAVEPTAGVAAPHAAPRAVDVSWHTDGRWFTLVVADRGSGLRADIDPFLPFVTSKPRGSGIGLALCREVVDAHGGRLALVNRDDGPGCWARVTLPVG